MKNNLVRWLFDVFSVAIVAVNAMLSFAFGYTYLGNAFGLGGFVSQYVGGLYALLVADVAFIVWFWVWRRESETKVQRDLALGVGVVSLVLSVAMSVNQLAVNSYGLVDLSAYHSAVGLVALTVVIIVTTIHIIGAATFRMASRDETLKSTSMNIKARLTDESMAGVEQTLDSMRQDIISKIQESMRRDVLVDLGIEQVKPVMKFQPSSNGKSREEEEPLH